ncbi:MAG: aminomethyl transferase family protein [Desulfobacula sp.]|nr:aminomethyl transferase family protein [Desulfobacula sp.]
MTESTRTSALASRHLALGSDLEDWNGMGTAWSYSSDPCYEHDAVRKAAGLFDMSGLKKIHVKGKDAEAVVDYIITRDMTQIVPGQSAYGPILTDEGMIADDAIIANMGGNEYIVVHGGGSTMELLEETAKGKDVTCEFDDDLHDISLQGPKALELLDAHTPMDLSSLKYFHQKKTKLFGHSCIISRTGYSGERGYEIFAVADVVCDLWDKILEHGKEIGVMPCSFTALDKVRIEAALLFYGYDMSEENTPWEVTLGWSVSARKGDFRGKEAVLAAKGREKVNLVGISIDHDDMLAGGEKLLLDGKEVGSVLSPGYSHRMKKSLALVHVIPEAAKAGTNLTVKGDDVNYAALIERTPFYDPEKTRTHQ